MKYKIIELQKASELVQKLLEGATPSFAEHEVELGRGPICDDRILADIARQIVKQQRTIEKQKEPREALDAIAFEIIHRGVPNDADMVGDGRFWVRFALVFLFDVIKWRFPGKDDKGFNLENLGIGRSQRKQAENYLYKLWARGEISYAPDARDPYNAGRRGSIDFWTSHIHRQGFTNCRAVARELIRFQYPPDLRGEPRLLPGEEDVAQGKVGVRTLVKRIRRLWATVEYTLLEPDEVRATIRELARGLTSPDGKRVSA
jgi:hypothetical protein